VEEPLGEEAVLAAVEGEVEGVQGSFTPWYNISYSYGNTLYSTNE
jgi:hypothetical protein